MPHDDWLDPLVYGMHYLSERDAIDELEYGASMINPENPQEGRQELINRFNMYMTLLRQGIRGGDKHG